MMLRQPFLLAAFGASLLSAPAFGQDAYGSGSGYGGTPPGYSDPYTQGAGGAGNDMQRSQLPPPGGYQQAPGYGAQASAPAQQPYQPAGYQPPANVVPQQGGYQASAYEEQQRAYGAAYNRSYEELTGAQPAQPQGHEASNTAPPAGVYATDAALVPGTDQAPAGPRIENVDPSEPVPDRFRRQIVDYVTTQAPGTIVVDTPNTYLYYVLGNGKAVRYGIGVGREGYTWSGVQKISRKAEWPDWRPPPEMIERQPYLPRFMAGGPGNPMGARAMYLGSTLYRIHGTNEPQTIGKFVSSGCIRLLNNDAEDLFSRVKVGAKVVIAPMPKTPKPQAAAANMPGQAPGATGSISGLR
ncbi:L,D-transpeptidase family protein [Xanthobacter sp. TB0139]|uniref:L,D-transpeptidase family protein n=1 Tax=Xanthobacter sp. TB0139 TaxID=3459178 RepID=UPI004039E913